MKKFIYFLIMLFKTCRKNNLVPLATELTYRLIFACFPFIIFLMSLIGYFNINSAFVLDTFSTVLPDDTMKVLSVFVHEVVDVRNSGILSVSLIISLYSASSGFNAIIRGINTAYDQKETRSFIRIGLISIFLVIILAFSIILSILLLVFGDSIYETLIGFLNHNPWLEFLFGLAGNLITMLVLLFAIIFIYKLGSCKKLTVYDVMPGALITLIVWLLASKAFNVYINNFARYSMIYGSIASIIIMMLWLNLISIIILVGAEINALLSEPKVV